MGELSQLKGLGSKSESELNEIGIFTRDDLEEAGAVQAFLALRASSPNTSLNFLYAMVGALEDKSWLDIAKEEKGKLLLELEDFADIQEMLKADGIEVE